jgi:hypothetical protein
VCKPALVWQCPSQLISNTKRATPVQSCRLDHDPYYQEQYKTALQQYKTLRTRSDEKWNGADLIEGDPWGYMFTALERLETEVDGLHDQGRQFFGRTDLYRDFDVDDDEFNIIQRQIHDLHHQADSIIDTTVEVQSPALDIILDQISSLEDTMLQRLLVLTQQQASVIQSFYHRRRIVQEDVIAEFRDEWEEERREVLDGKARWGKRGDGDERIQDNARNNDQADNIRDMTDGENKTQRDKDDGRGEMRDGDNGGKKDGEGNNNKDGEAQRDGSLDKSDQSMRRRSIKKTVNLNDDVHLPPLFDKHEISKRVEEKCPRPPIVIDITQFTPFRWDFYDPDDSYYKALDNLGSMVNHAIHGLKYQLCRTCCGLANLKEDRGRMSDHLCGKVHIAFRDIKAQIKLYTGLIHPLTVPSNPQCKPHLIHPWSEWGSRYVPPTELEMKQQLQRENLSREAMNKIDLLTQIAQNMVPNSSNSCQGGQNGQNTPQISSQENKFTTQSTMNDNDNNKTDDRNSESVQKGEISFQMDQFGLFSDDDLLMDPTMVLAIESIQPYNPFNRTGGQGGGVGVGPVGARGQMGDVGGGAFNDNKHIDSRGGGNLAPAGNYEQRGGHYGQQQQQQQYGGRGGDYGGYNERNRDRSYNQHRPGGGYKDDRRY